VRVDITCGRCRRSYFVPDDLVQGRTFRAKCSQCGHAFRVEVGSRAGRQAAPADGMPSTSASAIPDLADALAGADLGWLDEAAKAAEAAAGAEDELILLTVRRSRRGSALALAAGAIVLVGALGALALWTTGRYRLPGSSSRRATAAAPGGAAAPIEDVAGLALSNRGEPPPPPAPAPAPAASAPELRATPRLASRERRLLDLLARKQDAAPVGVEDEEAAASAKSALDPVAAEKVISAHRRAFDACVSRALRLNPSLKLARRATMAVTVQPDGSVAKASIAEEQVDRSDLGACLANAARRMVFPAFDGDAIDIAMPLSLSAVF
jgi:hypothetical protein